MEHSTQQILKLLDQKQAYSKSSEQMIPVIRALFHSPQALVEKITDLTRKNLKNKSQQFDIESIKKIYQNVEKLKLQDQVSKCYMEIAQTFEEPRKLQNFVKTNKDMKFFFIVILWDNLWTDPKNSLLMLKIINLINACPGYITNFQNWIQELNHHNIALVVGELQKRFATECLKLPNDLLEESDYAARLWLNINNIGKFMKIIWNSNNQVKRIPKEMFVCNELAKYFDITVQYKLFYHKKTRYSLLSFSFLMPLDYKYELLKIESILEQKLNIQKSMSSGFSGMISAMIQNNDFSLEGLIYLYIEVNRNDILNDSMQKLNKVKNLQAPLRISFVGEQGSDQGGVKNQYFQLVTKAIFNPYLDMFLPKNNGRVYWFNGLSYQPPIRFEFVGMLLGLAIYNSVHLQIPFPNVLYKKLLDKNQDDYFSPELLNDLADIEPDIQNGLKKLMETEEDLQDLEVYFTIETEHFGEKIFEELVEDGAQIKVTQDNKQEYCQLYADYLLNKSIKKQFMAFKKGFYKVVQGKMIELLNPDDLRTIIYGNDVIDFKELEEHTNYEGGYTKDTAIIKHLWQVLHSLKIDEKKAFLVFATGSDRVPIEGMKELNFVIQRHANTTHLPSAHTCFNVFLLPEYESKQKLQKMIKLILQNNQGFGLI